MRRSKDAMRLFIALSLASLETTVFLGGSAFAQENATCDTELCTDCDILPGADGCDGASTHDCRNTLWTRETLTGDWCGLRSSLKESGISFSGRSTHFGFGVEGGIQQQPVVPLLGLGDTFKYTGRGEYDLVFDLEKFGGLPKGSLLVRAEHWYGEYGNVSLRTGASGVG